MGFDSGCVEASMAGSVSGLATGSVAGWDEKFAKASVTDPGPGAGKATASGLEADPVSTV